MKWMSSINKPMVKMRNFLNWQKLHTTLSRLDALDRAALQSTASGTSDENYEKLITVSLTSYGQRIHDVHLVIESIFQQTLMANRVLLWLSAAEFSPENIPLILRKLEKRGLEIRYCDDLKSYKKIVPALQEGCRDAIITIDDDIIYPIDTIERLYRAHIAHPNRVHCNRAHMMKLDNAGKIKRYADWDYNTNFSDASYFLVPTGCLGIIYDSDLLHKDVTDSRTFMKLCPNADDLWLKAMSLKNGIKCQLIPDARPYESYVQIPNYHSTGLFQTNRTENDTQLAKLIDHYPELKQTLLMQS